MPPEPNPPVRGVTDRPTATVDLLWIPLGADAHVVRVCGKAFEAVVARFERRSPQDLFHTALVVEVPEARYAIEMTPVPDGSGASRGVVGEGPVGVRWAGRLRVFRYEIRRWADGVIPDAHAAVGGPVRLSQDPELARRLLALVPWVPTPTWGRDELGLGEMWNSNSVTAWLLASAGVDVDEIAPPRGGRAVGWQAGVVIGSQRRSAHGPSLAG